MIITLGLLGEYKHFIYPQQRSGPNSSDRATAHPFAIGNGRKCTQHLKLSYIKYILLLVLD